MKTIVNYAGFKFTIYSFFIISFVITEQVPKITFLVSWKHWSIVFHWPKDSGEKVLSGYKSFEIREFKNL